jgi:tetratricopeptide (TPR) repeat protein
MKKLVILAVLLISVPFVNGDKLWLKGSPRALEVDIEKDSWQEIAYAVEGGPAIQIDWSRVDRIEYERMDKPPYSLGERHFSKGNYSEALEAYLNTIKHFGRRYSWVNVYAGYKAGLCFFYLGKYNNARKLFMHSMKEPNTHYEPDCLIMIGKCYLKLNKFDDAEKSFNKVTEAKYGKSAESKSRAARVDLLFEKGDYGKAKSQYLAIRENIIDTYDVTRLHLSVKIGLCDILSQKLESGMKEVETVITTTVQGKYRAKISSAGADTILAAAYTAKGHNFFQKKDYKNALGAYLHSAVTYRHVGSADVAEASFKGALCLSNLISTAPDDETKKQMVLKTRELCGQTKRLYSGNTSKIRQINEILNNLPKV